MLNILAITVPICVLIGIGYPAGRLGNARCPPDRPLHRARRAGPRRCLRDPVVVRTFDRLAVPRNARTVRLRPPPNARPDPLRDLAAAFACAALVGACALPAERADHAARAQGYERQVLAGARFQHVAYFKRGAPDSVLHVYVEHDGVPWITPVQPSADPTPRRLLMLELMARDPAPALSLGRPCYFGQARVPPCEPLWWTHRRFSPEVVASMAAALTGFLAANREIEAVEIFGFSGGGALAALLAARIPPTRRLVTVAAPLDLDEWARDHDYTPLEGSLSPLREPPLSPAIRQLHLAGANDHVVRSAVIQPFAAAQPAAEFRELPGFDHDCCWDRVWTRDVLGLR
jgi:hypothetical protein